MQRQQDQQERHRMPLAERLGAAVQPLLAGMALDLVDLATFGPLGVSAGLVLGGIAGWALAPTLAPDLGVGRWLFAGLGALYCALPGTSVLPLASVMAFVLRLTREEPAAGPVMRERPQSHPDAIDVEYRVPDEGDSDGEQP